MIRIFKNLRKKDILLILLCLVLIVVQVWLDLKIPDYMSQITKLVQTQGTEIKDILVPGGYMILCALGTLLSSIIVGYFVSYIASVFSKNLRKKIFNKVEDYSMEEIKNFSVSSLFTRTTNDVNQVQMLIVFGMQIIIKAPILAIWAILKIYNKSWKWSALTGGCVLALLIFITFLIIFVLPKFKKVQKQIDKINDVTRENLSGIRVVRAFNAEKYQENKFEYANNNLTNTQTLVQKAMSLLSPTMFLIMYVLTLGIYFIGAYLIDSAGMLNKLNVFSDMVVFSTYAMQILMSFIMLALVFIIYPRANISAKRILEVLDTKSNIKDGNIDKDITNIKGKVEFKNVSFKYPDANEYILKDISFVANRGDTIAIIGSTGCGKSTLVNLIPRFYDVTEGEILVDEVNVKEYEQEYLHNKISYIPQKASMFSGSIKENVAYGKSLNKEESLTDIKEAIKVSQAEDFVLKLSDTYDHHIAQGGSNISGGQKQRLSIARAIMRKPEIYIFDDSFSALDYKTDYKLRKELKKYTNLVTNIIVSQRIGTIINADKIIVLDEGKCVGMGTHSELLKNCDVYKEIAYSQLSKEELENA